MPDIGVVIVKFAPLKAAFLHLDFAPFKAACLGLTKLLAVAAPVAGRCVCLAFKGSSARSYNIASLRYICSCASSRPVLYVFVGLQVIYSFKRRF